MKRMLIALVFVVLIAGLVCLNCPEPMIQIDDSRVQHFMDRIDSRSKWQRFTPLEIGGHK